MDLEFRFFSRIPICTRTDSATNYDIYLSRVWLTVKTPSDVYAEICGFKY